MVWFHGHEKHLNLNYFLWANFFFVFKQKTTQKSKEINEKELIKLKTKKKQQNQRTKIRK